MPTESWVVAGPQIIEVEQVDALRVQLVGGRVDVVAHDAPTTRIEVHAVDGRPLEVTLSDGELRVGYSFTLGGWEGFLEKFRNFRDKDRADVHIAIPRSVRAKVGTVSAEGLLAGVDEDASVSTVSGSLVTDVHARAAVGEHGLRGDRRARPHRSAQAQHRLGRARGVRRAHARAGQLGLGRPPLDVTTGSSSVTASTVSGDVTVRLPQEQGVRVQAQSVSGRLVVDGREYKDGKPAQRKVDLTTGDGGCFVSANTVSGHVTVLRSAP